MVSVANRTLPENPSVDVDKALMEPEEFRRYFHERVTPDKERWHELWNNITEDDLSEIYGTNGVASRRNLLFIK